MDTRTECGLDNGVHADFRVGQNVGRSNNDDDPTNVNDTLGGFCGCRLTISRNCVGNMAKHVCFRFRMCVTCLPMFE